MRKPKIHRVLSYQDSAGYVAGLPEEVAAGHRKILALRFDAVHNAMQPTASLKTITDSLLYLSSQSVAEYICRIFQPNDHPGKVFWHVIADEWSRCDCASFNRRPLEALFRRYRADVHHYYAVNSEAKKFLDSLPDPVTIYRGHDIGLINGLSWTRKKEIAAKFAQGMRFQKHDFPTVATATIRKRQIFFVDQSRNEFEVVAAPHRFTQKIFLRSAKSADFTPPKMPPMLSSSWPAF